MLSSVNANLAKGANLRVYHCIPFILAFLLFPALLTAQSITGTISGTIVDSSNHVMVQVNVVLVSDRTGDTRATLTNESGDFLFPALQPGSYSIKVDHPGFRSFQRTGNVLTANERLHVGNLELTVGSVTETVTVTAQGAQVQTTSSDRSALLSNKQMEMIAIRGRDVISMLRILPGVAQQVDTENLGGSFGTGMPNIQGSRNSWSTVTVDGLTGNDLGSPQVNSSPMNLDAIGEVKVLLNNYQAENGRNGGAFINVVTKSGSREYHGALYGFKRHEQFNANSFFNNRGGITKPRYRFATLGGTLGGPVYIPKLAPRGQERLFFFYSFEDSRTTTPQGLRQVTTPTAEERAGDFSNSLDTNNRLIAITDPLTGPVFPGNRVPTSRINRNGQAILNIFPLPNTFDRALTRGNFNYQFQESIAAPRWQHLFKVDLKPTTKDSFSFRGSLWFADQLGHAVSAGSSNWGLIRQHYTYTDNGVVMTHTRILSPRVVNEFMGGVRHSVEKGPPESDQELAKVQRGSRGLTLGQLFPANNVLRVIPQASFGGVPGAATITYDGRFPLRGADTVIDFNDNLTYSRGSHTFKFGFNAQRLRNYEGESGTYGGSFNFGRDVNNPFDSNYAYSNAMLGNFQSYTESNTRPSNEGRKTILGWYAQDTWRVSRKLTLDYGLRLLWYTQWVHATGLGAAFSLDRFDPAKAPRFYSPVRAPEGRRALNPITGQILPAVLIGAIIPGSGDPVNGSVVATDKNYPAGFKDREPLLFEPRFGFAYDVFGNSKTAVRGSFGVFHNTVSPGVRSFSWNPPVQFNPQLFYGNLDTFLSSTGVNFPSTISGFVRKAPTPSVYNFSFGIQHDLGFATVLDVAYVGSLGRHLDQSRNINAVPYGARFLPQNADPSNPATPLNDNFFRPYSGWGSITLRENASTSNYNSLQLSLNRRFAKGLQFGLAYTWAKTMDFTDTDGGGVAQFRPIRIWNYGKAGFDQTHILVINYTWDLPGGSRILPNRVTRLLMDNWQLSGITSFFSGFPAGIGFSTVDAVDITGGGDGARIIVNGKAALPHGERSFSRWFDPNVFARPPRGDFGNAPKDVIRLPGANNWDIAFFKNFPVKSEGRYFQLRWEMYNAFNHTQFSGIDTTARFDAQGRQVNARFGEVTGTRTERRMQASLRFTF